MASAAIVHTVDIQILHALNAFFSASSIGETAAIIMAEYVPYGVIGALPFFLWHMRKRGMNIFAIGKTLVGGTVIARGIVTPIVRVLFPRMRPFITENVSTLFYGTLPSSYSFPSGHAAFYFALSAACYSYNKRWGTWFFAVSILNGIGRIAVGVHYPSDIIMGALIGCVCGMGAVYIVKRSPKQLAR